MKYVLDFSKELLQDCLKEDSVVADFTMGNGYDTLFLVQNVPNGKVYAFDIQKQALEHTRQLLQQAGLMENVQLILDSHANLDLYIQEEIDAGVFNLGYLPGSNKTVVTKAKSTILALQKALRLLKQGGILVLTVYPGHPGGAEESESLLALTSRLDAKEYDVLQYQFLNKQTPPYILAIQKRCIK